MSNKLLFQLIFSSVCTSLYTLNCFAFLPISFIHSFVYVKEAGCVEDLAWVGQVSLTEGPIEKGSFNVSFCRSPFPAWLIAKISLSPAWAVMAVVWGYEVRLPGWLHTVSFKLRVNTAPSYCWNSRPEKFTDLIIHERHWLWRRVHVYKA